MLKYCLCSVIFSQELFIGEDWNFYTLLLSSGSRSEGSIAVITKLDFHFVWFSILYHSHNLKTCFKKCPCVCFGLCVCVCLSVWPSSNVEAKPIDRSRSKSISRVLSQISWAAFFFLLVFPVPLKLSIVHIRKLKIWIFSKMAPNDFD